MRLIKRYKNRRLYDTGARRSITLSDIARFIKDKEDFKVVESETGEDITGTTIIQVLLAIERRTKELGNMVATIRHSAGKKTERLIGFLNEHIRSILKIMDRTPASEPIKFKSK